MKLCVIVAATDNGVIGKDGVIPWKMPGEQARFKQISTGHPIIMGRQTYETCIRRRVLPGRTNIIVTHDKAYQAGGCLIANSLEEALSLARKAPGAEEVFIIGGQGIYQAAMPKIQKIYLTRIHATIDGDRFFKYEPEQWQEISHEECKKDERNAYDYDFVVLERKKP